MKPSRRIFLPFLAVFILCAFTACGGSVPTPPEISTVSASPFPSETIVIPKHVAELAGVDIAALDISASIERQQNGSLIYHLQPEEKKRLLTDMKETLDAYLAALPDRWPFVERVQPDSTFESVILFTNKSSYSPERDSKIAGALYAPIVLYRAFAEFETPDDFALRISVTDSTDYAVLDTLTYPVQPSGNTDAKTGDDSTS